MRQLKITKSITNRESLSLEQYLLEISREPMISAEMEVELAKKIKQGDRVALEKLTKANLRFVVSVAKQYQNKGSSLPDLINEGNLGLIKAAQRFDETRGFKFISYAVWWIRQSILQSIAENSRVVRIPLNKIGSLNKVNKVSFQLEQELQRNPTIEEVAKKLDFSNQYMKDTLEANSKSFSLDNPLSTDADSTFLDVMENTDSLNPETPLMTESLQREIERALSTLSEREADVLRLYFGIFSEELGNSEGSMTLNEIGREIDLTPERVRQIKEKALRRLKHQSRSKLLKTYLG